MVHAQTLEVSLYQKGQHFYKNENKCASCIAPVPVLNMRYNAFILYRGGDMNQEADRCAVTGEDLKAALAEMKGYVDVTVEDLMKIYALALENARVRVSSTIPVGDVMTTHVITVRAEADLHEVTRLLTENSISGLPVVDHTNRVIGLISEADVLSMTGVRRGHTFRDLIRHILGEPVPKDAQGRTVGDFMTSPAVTVTADTDIREAAKVLDEKRIKRLPVVDHEQRLVGILSRADIVRTIGKQ
jgi:CBS domain-containing membrane protein